MNTNAIKVALPFAAITDVAFIAKVFYGYSDPTLTYVAIGSLVVVALLVLKAFDLLKLPSFSRHCSAAGTVPQQIVHNHYHSREDEDEEQDDRYDEGYEEGYEEGKNENLNDNGNYDEGHKDGYKEGHADGRVVGYDARKAEERTEATELAKYILDAVKNNKEKDVTPTAKSCCDKAE